MSDSTRGNANSHRTSVWKAGHSDAWDGRSCHHLHRRCGARASWSFNAHWLADTDGHCAFGQAYRKSQPAHQGFVPLAALNDIVFGGWDPIPDDAYTAAKKAGVHESADLEAIGDFMKAIKPMPAVFESRYVTRITGATNVKTGKNKRDLAEQLRNDIRDFKEKNGCTRAVMVWTGSTETYIKAGAVHETIESFEKAMEENDDSIAPSMLYAYAAIMEGVHIATAHRTCRPISRR